MTDFTANQKEYLENLFSKINSAIELKTSQILREIKEEIEEIDKRSKEKLNLLEERVNAIEAENTRLNQRLLFFERKARKNNVVIYGIDKVEIDLPSFVCNIFRNQLDLEISQEDFDKVHSLNPDKDKSPVLVEFNSYRKKLLVLKNSKKLKGSNIYISNDQCPEDRERSKILSRHLRETRNRGVQAHIKGNKLYISNKQYTVEQLETQSHLEDCMDAETIEETSEGETSIPGKSVPNCRSKTKSTVETDSEGDRRTRKQGSRIRKLNARGRSAVTHK